MICLIEESLAYVQAFFWSADGLDENLMGRDIDRIYCGFGAPVAALAKRRTRG